MTEQEMKVQIAEPLERKMSSTTLKRLFVSEEYERGYIEGQKVGENKGKFAKDEIRASLYRELGEIRRAVDQLQQTIEKLGTRRY